MRWKAILVFVCVSQIKQKLNWLKICIELLWYRFWSRQKKETSTNTKQFPFNHKYLPFDMYIVIMFCPITVLFCAGISLIGTLTIFTENCSNSIMKKQKKHRYNGWVVLFYLLYHSILRKDLMKPHTRRSLRVKRQQKPNTTKSR